MSVAEGLEFVDTNILVYAFTAGTDSRQLTSRKLYDRLISEDLLCLSTQVLQEFFVTLTRKYGHNTEAVIGYVRDLAEWPYFTIDAAAIEEAGWLSHNSKISFWDALVIVSARRMGAKTLYSADLSHGQVISGVTVINPFHQTV